MKPTIFIIPFILPWDRPADYQRQTCFELAGKHKVIAYMQKDAVFFLKAVFGTETYSSKYLAYKNISFYRPLYLFPFRRISVIEAINRTVSFVLFQIFILQLRRSIFWIFDPEFCTFPKLIHGISIYDCVDYHAGFHQGEKAATVRKQEVTLIKKVDYFFVNSHVLYRLHRSVRKPDAIVPQGFRLGKFRFLVKAPIQISQKKPVIGYVGALDYRLDTALLKSLIQNNLRWTFVLWGSSQSEEKNEETKVKQDMYTILHLPNVITGESRDSQNICSIIQQFTIGIIPYRETLPGVTYSYPMKLFEYFYMGKPVLSTSIEELRRFPTYVKIGKTAKSWEKHITSLLSCSWPISYQEEQQTLARQNSWKRKIDMIMSYISGSGQ